MTPTPKYVARYKFAGATGRSGICETREAAEVEADKLNEHFCGVADIWIDTQPTAQEGEGVIDPTGPDC